ncbi:tubulin polyglutamylase TTLL5 isoform X3 [Nothobranchius furzeri]|uniref:tubulin polyglutamylase TTLL5 isoform X3 n=1 Tax=Nothobranchius furzeri TaxID=105023 RepID=UPI0039049E15
MFRCTACAKEFPLCGIHSSEHHQRLFSSPRFATVKYDQTPTNIKNTFMHLTNYSLNKKSSDYVSCDDPEVEDYGNKWSMSAVLRYLKQEGKDTTLLMKQVEDLVIKAVLSAELQIAAACKMFVPHKTNCFELYGFDVLIDSNLKPWLLEVNLSPSLSCDAPLDLKIKASMIADMFSLVGFVCQDPLSRLPRSDRVPSEKYVAAQRAQKCFSAPTPTVHIRLRQRPATAVCSETDGFKDKQGPKHSQGDSTLSLTAEEIKVLRRIKEEYERRGGFIRIFPTADTWELYGGYLESKTSMNLMLANRLFHGRNVNGSVQLQVDTVHGCHAVQYERKLLSLETRKRRQRHLSHHSAARKKKLGRESKASLTENRSQEAEECAQEEREEAQPILEPASHKALVTAQRKQVDTPLERCHNKSLSSLEAAVHNARPTVNLLNILQQGWDLSKVQARIAFSSYLHRVQHRLLAESRANAIPAWPDKDNDQMELVVRFLRRAVCNLQQDIKVVFPNRQLPLQDRRRILSHQLGEFLRCYNKETEQMEIKHEKIQEKCCVNQSVFQEYITAASEVDLEEVLTFYTQKHKTAMVFLGTKVPSVRKDVQDSGNHKKSSSFLVDSSASESSFSAGKIGSDPDLRAAEIHPFVSRLPSDQQTEVTAGKSQPDVQSSQHSSSFPLTLNCSRVHLQHRSLAPTSLPLHCPPPPPPQPPSYAQSLAKSHFSHPETHSDPPAYTSAPVITQPSKVIRTAASTASSTVTTGQFGQVIRRNQCFTTPTSSSGETSSGPAVIHTYNQKLSRPTSAGQEIRRSSSSGSNSVGTFRELQSLSAQAQSNQQAFISALQRLANKQVARHCASSSHINLLTQHLSSLNLASRMLGRESFSLNPKAATTQRPARAAQCGKEPISSKRPLKDKERPLDGRMQTSSNLVKGLNPVQHYQPAQGSYQLEFAIQQLQQQRLKSHHQIQDQVISRIQISDQTSVPQVSTKPPSCSPSSFHAWPNPNPIQTGISPGFAPKPPNCTRDGEIRKMATKRIMKQMSSESSASGSVSSGKQVVYEAMCGKTGLSVYQKLLQGQDPSHR